MRKTFLTSTVIAAAAGMTIGAAQASAGSFSFTSSASMLSSSDSESQERATSALDGMLTRFIKVDASEASTAAAGHDEDNCPEKKDDRQVADVDEDKKAAKSEPQGPEPIYFAF